MTKKIILMFIIIIFSFFVFNSCSYDQDAEIPNTPNAVSTCYVSDLSELGMYKCRHAEEYHAIPATLIDLIGNEAYQNWRDETFGNIEGDITKYNAVALIEDFQITKEAFIEDQPTEGTIGLLSQKVADIIYSEDSNAMSKYYTNLSRIVCFHKKDFHLADEGLREYIENSKESKSWNTVLSQSNPEKRNLKDIIDFFQIPKSVFSTIADSSALDYNADILYGEAPGISEYYKDSRMQGCKHAVSYYTIDARLLEYVGYYESPEAAYWANQSDAEQIKRAFSKLDQKYQWLSKYDKNPEDINIVNFVKDHGIAKQDFEQIVKESVLDYNADIIYSNDEKKIESYYDINTRAEKGE